MCREARNLPGGCRGLEAVYLEKSLRPQPTKPSSFVQRGKIGFGNEPSPQSGQKQKSTALTGFLPEPRFAMPRFHPAVVGG